MPLVYWTICLLISFPALFFLWIHTASLRSGNQDALIILGYKCDGNTIHPLLLERLQTALRLIRLHHYKKIIVTGGKVGTSSKTEAEIMRDFLIDRGIPSRNIVLESEARDTIENLANCKRIFEQEALRDCLIVSNSFHIRRIQFIARAVGLKPAFYAERSPGSLLKQWNQTFKEARFFYFTYQALKQRKHLIK